MVVKSPAKIYINWDVDTVCPMRQSEKVIKHSVAARMRMGPAFVASTAQIQEQHPKICRLALNINDWDWTSGSYRYVDCLYLSVLYMFQIQPPSVYKITSAPEKYL